MIGPSYLLTSKAANKDHRVDTNLLHAANIVPTVSLLPYSPDFLLGDIVILVSFILGNLVTMV